MSEQFTIVWRDGGREPQCPANPAYPHGIDVDMSREGGDSCCTELPYPARRCGIWLVVCRRCKLRVGVTAAGRRDDPRSVTVECKEPRSTAALRQVAA